MRRQLVVTAGLAASHAFPLDDGQTLTIGRGQSSETQVSDPHMSRVRCCVRVDGGKTLLLDADSSSGTCVGGEKVDQRDLAPGDVFQIGDTQIRYQPPFERSSLPGLIEMVREEKPESPKKFQLSIDDMFGDLVMRMIEKRPEDRYQTPKDLLQDLQRLGKDNTLEADWSDWRG